MVVVEDDSILHPEIEADLLLYIQGLDENQECYTRFFDALLIKRDLHRSFFRDLKAFRGQPRVIALLEKASEDKKIYRDVTNVYLTSRFAHPWCRKTPLKKGFWRAEWGNIEGKQRDADITREEDRLHKLLVPIWVIMRSRMFPDEDTVKQWCVQERNRLKHKEESRLTLAALKMHDETIQEESPQTDDVGVTAVSDSDIDEDDRERAAYVATSVFRLAAAGAILSRTPKRKLRWLIKK